MTEAERLAERTPERIWLIDMGDCIAWCDDPDPSGTGEDDAVEYVQSALLRSQAEELERLRSDITRQMAIANSECNRAERLRGALASAMGASIGEYITRAWTNEEGRRCVEFIPQSEFYARAALGETKAAPEQEQA